MNKPSFDPVTEFEHNHGRINDLVLRASETLDATRASFAGVRLDQILGELREELLSRFAREEEGLFPFVRSHMLDHCEIVDSLESGHDSICGGIVRLAHLAERRAETMALVTAFKRFERAYLEHGKLEGELLRDIGRRLDPEHRAALAELVRGL